MFEIQSVETKKKFSGNGEVRECKRRRREQNINQIIIFETSTEIGFFLPVNKDFIVEN